MSDLIADSFAWVNLPFTLLLGLVIIHWTIVAMGLIGLDSLDFDLDGNTDVHLDVHSDLDVHADFQADADAQVDVRAEADVDGNIDGDPAMEGGADAHEGNESGMAGGGHILTSLLQFVNADHVPVLIILSVLSVSMWTTSVVANHYLNSGLSGAIALALLVPNVILSLMLTKMITLPLRPLFRTFKEGTARKLILIGKTCIVRTSEVTASFGQAEVIGEEGQILLNVTCQNGDRIKKGDEVVIVSHTPDRRTYEVVKM